MEINTKVAIEKKVVDGDKERNYQFIFSYGSPIGESYDFCHEVLQQLTEMAQKANERSKQNKEEKPEAK